MKKLFSIMSHYKLTITSNSISKKWTNIQAVNPRPQTQEQSVAKPGTPLQTILVENLNLTQRSPRVPFSVIFQTTFSNGFSWMNQCINFDWYDDNDNDNDNDNENNFIVMNCIGTMTAVTLNIASRHLNIAFEYWHSILKFTTKGAWSPGL